MFRKRKENEFRKELLDQLEGMINIEIGNYIYSNKLEMHIEAINGIDVYIYDKDFAYINHYNMIDFMPPNFMFKGLYIDDISLIGHYHSEDLLYLIMNFKTEKEAMLKKVDKYIKWKEAYLKRNQGELKENNV